ncbi:hypothetical protein H632_c1891p0 [Helicosporidium sp. ATCC 50920]|nr:hypothetical protein H632_c1891p0 [Helicosporidium sp. ATCC 50920]|eukprot:KDD73725.1 hypothetical protein H632_c1891p0 [Helicosporidium sp. ATCC 50920]
MLDRGISSLRALTSFLDGTPETGAPLDEETARDISLSTGLGPMRRGTRRLDRDVDPGALLAPAYDSDSDEERLEEQGRAPGASSTLLGEASGGAVVEGGTAVGRRYPPPPPLPRGQAWRFWDRAREEVVDARDRGSYAPPEEDESTVEARRLLQKAGFPADLGVDVVGTPDAWIGRHFKTGEPYLKKGAQVVLSARRQGGFDVRGESERWLVFGEWVRNFLAESQPMI